MSKDIQVGVIAYQSRTSKTILSQLEAVLGDVISFRSHSLEENGVDKFLDGVSLLLVTTQTYTGLVAKWARTGVDILVIQRTITKQSWEMIMGIPPRSRLLLVNDDRDSAVETISLLHELGAKHLEFIPFYPGVQKVPPHIELAVTPGEPFLVPGEIKRVYNIGDRVVDASTLFDILSRFNLLNEQTSNNITRYMETIIPRSKALKMTLDKLSDIKLQLEQTLDMVNDGIISYDREGKIFIFNDKAEQITGKKAWEVVGQNLHECFSFFKTGNLLALPKITNRLMSLKEKNVVINKKTLLQKTIPAGGVITLQDVTEVQQLEKKLRQELKAKGHVAKYTFDDILGTSPQIRRVKNISQRVAGSSLGVILQGESGSGKELFAHAIHNASTRKRAPFVAINCSALPETLLESELFGYEEGAFTGAKKGGKPGLFEQAHTGTIFLDEIGDMSLSLQGRLLRVLQEKEILKVGATKVIPVDVRVIAATNKDLDAMVRQGLFRKDLFFRLNVFPISIPPLRERKEDIPILAHAFLRRMKPGETLPEPLIAFLQQYNWPGNVRELENAIEYLVTMAEEGFSIEHLPDRIKFRGNSGIDFTPASSEKELQATPEELAVLKLFFEAAKEGKKAGRRTIAARSQKAGTALTEQEVRRIIKLLEAKGLLQVSLGRGATSITREGETFLLKQWGQ